MIDKLDNNSLPQIAGAVIVAIVGLIYGIQKLPNRWKESKVEASLVEMVHQELERLSAQNTLLSEEIAKLQTQVFSLIKEINSLSIDKERLKKEVIELRKKVLTYTLSDGENNVGKT
jgi:cell division protein FtsB